MLLRAEVGSLRLASSAQWAGVSSEAGSRITSFTSSRRITRPTRSTIETLGSGRSSRRRRNSSPSRPSSGSATRSSSDGVESEGWPGLTARFLRADLVDDLEYRRSVLRFGNPFDRVSRGDGAFLEDRQVKSRSAAREESPDHVGPPESNAELVARKAW